MALPGHDIESFLPSEIARLVYGYLEEEECPIAAQAFLETSVHLKECLAVARKGKKFNTKILGLSLADLLDLLSEAICFANEHRRELLESKSSRKDSKLMQFLQIEVPIEVEDVKTYGIEKENSAFKPNNYEEKQLSSFGPSQNSQEDKCVQEEGNKFQYSSKCFEEQTFHTKIKEEDNFEDLTKVVDSEEDEDRLASMEVFEPPQSIVPQHSHPLPTALLQVLTPTCLGPPVSTVFMQQPSLYHSSPIFPDSAVDSVVSSPPMQMPIIWSKLKQREVWKTAARDKKEKIVYKMQDRNLAEKNRQKIAYLSRLSSKFRPIAPKLNQA